MINAKIRLLSPAARIPTYATDGAAAFDLYAAEDVIIAPGETKKVPLGFAIEVPPGHVMYVMMRSGVALKTKLRQPNGIGVIDSDYRGEVAMMFENTAKDYAAYGDADWPTLIDGTRVVGVNLLDGETIIRAGDRVAQAVIVPVPHATFEVVAELSETARGSGGFGSTGVGGGGQ